MEIFEEQYEMRATVPAYWHNKSADLHSSARVLWKAMEADSQLQITCCSTYKMLMGMSFEVLIKAHCIAQKIKNDKIHKTHQLTKLAEIAGLKLTKEDKKILDILTEYVIWDGKYPTPKKSIHLKMHNDNIHETTYDKKSLGTLNVYKSNDSLDFSSLNQIWRKLSGEYMEKYNQVLP
jgi:hypothetical protein